MGYSQTSISIERLYRHTQMCDTIREIWYISKCFFWCPAEATAMSAGMSQTCATFLRWLGSACPDASKQHLIPLRAI